MHRLYYLKGLTRFFDVNWISRSIKLGLDSGYSPCCVTWFFIRAFSMDIYGSIMNNVRPYQSKPIAFRTEWEYQEWKRSEAYRRRLQHVACPVHRLLFFLTKKEHHYITCKECSWIQYEVPECNNCAQDDVYETKERMRHGI